MVPKLSNLRKETVKDLSISAVIVAVALSSFFLGRLSVGKHEGITVREENFSQSGAIGASGALAGGVVASKGGDKYHFPWCAGAQHISPENRIWFASVEEARKAGYSPAGNCKGLQ